MSTSKELVPVAEARPPDAYERRYMAGDGTVLFRDKSRAPPFLHAIFGVAAAAVIASAIPAGTVLGVMIGLPLLAIAWLLFAVLRVTVSERALTVHYALFGPTIPIAAIESAEPMSYDWKKIGRRGERRSWAGEWTFNMPGDGGRAVRVLWRDRRGRERITLVGSRRADELAAEIKRARAVLAAATSAALPEPGDD